MAASLLSGLRGVSPRLLLVEQCPHLPSGVRLGTTDKRHTAAVARLGLVHIERELDPNDNKSRFLVRVRDAGGNVAVWRAKAGWSAS